MSALEAVLSTGLWLAGVAVLLRWPIFSVGFGVGLVVWTWRPEAFWALVGLAIVAQWAWGRYGPDGSLLERYPVLAVALVAGVVALLAGGRPAMVALAVTGVAVGWFVAVTIVGLPDRFGGSTDAHPVVSDASVHVPPAGSSSPLGAGAFQVQVAPCPSCGGLLVATGREEPAAGAEGVFVAQATCLRCGLHLSGLADASRPEDGVMWFEAPADPRRDIA